MFINKLTIAAVILAASGASAGDVSPGAIMLAHIAGVEPGTYSVAEIIRLEDAREETSQASETRFILKHGGTTVARRNPWTPARRTEGTSQLAASVDADPDKHSISELIFMKTAADENDRSDFGYYAKGTNRRSTDDDVGRVTPAKAQIAAALGVDPAAYSLSELVELRTAEID